MKSRKDTFVPSFSVNDNSSSFLLAILYVNFSFSPLASFFSLFRCLSLFQSFLFSSPFESTCSLFLNISGYFLLLFFYYYFF